MKGPKPLGAPSLRRCLCPLCCCIVGGSLDLALGTLRALTGAPGRAAALDGCSSLVSALARPTRIKAACRPPGEFTRVCERSVPIFSRCPPRF